MAVGAPTDAVHPDAALGRRRHILLALVVGQVCLHAAMAGLRLALPLMLLRQGGLGGLGAEVSAGLLLGLFAVAPVLTAVHAGRWTDRRGYHRPVRSAVALVLLGGTLAVPAAAWPTGAPVALQALLLLLTASLAGAGSNLGLIAIQRSAGRLASFGRSGGADGAPPEPDRAELKRVFSWLGVAPSFSNMVGPMLAGVLIDAGGFALACGVLGLLPLGALASAARVPRALAPGSADAVPARAGLDPRRPVTRGRDPQGKGAPVDASPAPAPAARHGVWSLLTLPGLAGILAVNWFFSTSWDLHTFLVPLMGHQLGLSASAIGTVLGVFAFSVTAVRVVIPMLADRLTEHRVLSAAMGVVAAVFFVYPWAGSASTMGLCAVVLGIALGAVQPMILSTLHQLAPTDQQGEVIALRSAVINLSSTVLPLVFGLMGGAWGSAVLFRGMGLLLVLSLWLPRRLARVRPLGA